MIDYLKIFKRVSILENLPTKIYNKTIINKPLYNHTVIKPNFEITDNMLESMKKLEYKTFANRIEDSLKIVNGYK